MTTSSTATPFVLASLVAAYPCDDFETNVETLLCDLRGTDSLDEELGDFVDAYAAVKAEGVLDDIRSDAIDLFDRGRHASSLFESEYGRDRVLGKGQLLADIAGFYAAFGFDFRGGEGTGATADHVAVELEFYALMLMKRDELVRRGDDEGIAIVDDARVKFLDAHLGRIPRSIASRPAVASHPFFGAAFRFVARVVEDECKRLSVTPTRVEWITSLTDDNPSECGSVNSPIA